MYVRLCTWQTFSIASHLAFSAPDRYDSFLMTLKQDVQADKHHWIKHSQDLESTLWQISYLANIFYSKSLAFSPADCYLSPLMTLQQDIQTDEHHCTAMRKVVCIPYSAKLGLTPECAPDWQSSFEARNQRLSAAWTQGLTASDSETNHCKIPCSTTSLTWHMYRSVYFFFPLSYSMHTGDWSEHMNFVMFRHHLL